MKNRGTNLLYISIAVSVLLLLVNGCASTGKNAKDVSELSAAGSEEQPKGLKINEFILGAGDTIEITVYRHDDLKKSIKIDNSGMISYPLAGDIKASGLGILQLRDAIRDKLATYIVSPQVSINVTSVQSQKFTVIGEVNNPGVFNLENPVNLLEAMAKSGGFTQDAKQKSILLIRGGISSPELVKINLEDTLNDGNFTHNINVQNGDIIYVPATVIANVSRYFAHISKIIAPFISMESAYFTGQQIEGARGSAAVSR